uniref:Uncharacterized protein LOC113797611 n=1 Tax=Dermatophagoides pteronyssinus TaxID=6956 RepID=A0A6P6YEB1_DERPT|nr:uncharacterized protein LOC113797611 [Dermatophagoides pteronyssinus]
MDLFWNLLMSSKNKMDIRNFDNHTSISIIFFTIVDFIVFSVLFLPEWIVSNVGGDVQIGLWKTCIINRKRIHKCFSFSPPLPWKLAIIFIIIGCFFDTLAIISFIKSFRNPLFRRYGRWFGLFTLFFFSTQKKSVEKTLNFTHEMSEH